ncbi:MAG: hypothetical protein FWE50_03120 [Alphaproteobacteria bacterium]|nr:hypothetical protein [Alphaproteobacteria bacterium]
MKKAVSFFIFTFCFSGFAFADDCLSHKVSPTVEVIRPEWTVEAMQPSESMDALHGTVAATFEEEYNLSVASEPLDAGYCVVLRSVRASVGYTDFLVRIDASHIPGSCGYDMTMEHEEEHITAHIAALDGEYASIEKTIETAANSIMPVFVKSLDGVDAVLDKMQSDLQNDPGIILMKQKLDVQQEIGNKKVDEHDDGKRINSCK